MHRSQDISCDSLRYSRRSHNKACQIFNQKTSLSIQFSKDDSIFSSANVFTTGYCIISIPCCHGVEELAHFKDCIATVKYMETIYKFLQLHDVSNKTQHIHQRDANTAPYININDARLSWLNGEFIQYRLIHVARSLETF
jgi:hypothetical protein